MKTLILAIVAVTFMVVCSVVPVTSSYAYAPRHGSHYSQSAYGHGYYGPRHHGYYGPNYYRSAHYRHYGYSHHGAHYAHGHR